MDNATLYHVAPADAQLSKGLLSLADQKGEAEAIELFAQRWPDAAEWAAHEVHKVCLYARLEDAREHQDLFGGQVVAVDTRWYDLTEDTESTKQTPIYYVQGPVEPDYLTVVG